MGIGANTLAHGWTGAKESLLGAGLGWAVASLRPAEKPGRRRLEADRSTRSFSGSAAPDRRAAGDYPGGWRLMAVVLILWKKRVGRTLRNLGHMVAALFTLHLPGPELSLDNPDSLKVPFGVAVAVAVVLYTVRQAWAVLSSRMKLSKKSRATPAAPRSPRQRLCCPWFSCCCLGFTGSGGLTTPMPRSPTRRVRERGPPPRPRRTFGKHSSDAGSGSGPGGRGTASLQAESEPGDSALPNPALKDCTTLAPVATCAAIGGGNPQICFQSNVQINGTSTGPPACGVSVSFQYPYQFYLPFTSLNKQLIMLKANVQTTGEN